VKTFAYKLYPSKAQRKRLEAVLEVCRVFYNDCLEERKTAREKEGRTIGKFEQMRKVKVFKKSSELANSVQSHVLQVVVADLQKAFDSFFRRVKAKENPGYPRFKAKYRFRSFGLKQYGCGFKVDGRKLRLSGIGRISVRWHRPMEGEIKTVRIVRKASGWYACFVCGSNPSRPSGLTTEIGVDAGLTSLLTLSNGECVENPRWYHQSQRKLRRIQRRVSRRTKGGSNRRKAVEVLARFSERVSNQRKDFLNKLAYSLTKRFGRIAIEDLRIPKMVRGRLSKSILDAGWGYLKQRLLHKAENAGQTVVLVDPAYTTQDCCQCKQRQQLRLKDRWYSCENCGNSRCRDENAALNILQAGRACWSLSSALAGLDQETAG
jgi:putative transposase